MVWVYEDEYGEFPEFAFSNLMECFDFLKDHRDESEYKDHYTRMKFMNLIKDDAFTFIEEKLDCFGICNQAFFYTQKDLYEGRP